MPTELPPRKPQPAPLIDKIDGSHTVPDNPSKASAAIVLSAVAVAWVSMWGIVEWESLQSTPDRPFHLLAYDIGDALFHYSNVMTGHPVKPKALTP